MAQALAQTVDRIRPSVRDKMIGLPADGADLERRRAAWSLTIVAPQERRGYDRLYAAEVTQADEGCEFEMLKPFRMNDEPLEIPAPGVHGP